MKHSEESRMKYIMILFCLGVCYVSLPVSSHVVANGPTTDEQPAPAAADTSEAATEEKPAATEESNSESKDADKNGAAEKSEEKPADTAETAKTDTEQKDIEKTEAKTDAAKADAKEEKEEKKAKKKERKTAKVEAKRVKVVVTLDGTFTADEMTPVTLRPETWSQFEIVEVVPHGSEVHEGQTLIKFDREKIDEEIADLELDQHVSELAIRKAEQELPRLEKTLSMNATEAE